MNNQDLKKFMTFGKKEIIEPLSVISLNDKYIIAIYKGKKGPADILIKYRQKLKNGKWSNIRTPKHIHWTVDILMKLSKEPELTKQFLEDLERIWEALAPISKKERDVLKLESLLDYDEKTLEKYRTLSFYGEYNIKFLILLAKLLMIQEKTNYPKGKIFQNLIKKLKEGEDLFSILQIATLKKLS